MGTDFSLRNQNCSDRTSRSPRRHYGKSANYHNAPSRPRHATPRRSNQVSSPRSISAQTERGLPQMSPRSSPPSRGSVSSSSVLNIDAVPENSSHEDKFDAMTLIIQKLSMRLEHLEATTEQNSGLAARIHALEARV